MIDLANSAGNLKTHLNNLHDMEMFYGEPILQNLISHCQEVAEVVEEYEDIMLDPDGVEEAEFDKAN